MTDLNLRASKPLLCQLKQLAWQTVLASNSSLHVIAPRVQNKHGAYSNPLLGNQPKKAVDVKDSTHFFGNNFCLLSCILINICGAENLFWMGAEQISRLEECSQKPKESQIHFVNHIFFFKGTAPCRSKPQPTPPPLLSFPHFVVLQPGCEI